MAQTQSPETSSKNPISLPLKPVGLHIAVDIYLANVNYFLGPEAAPPRPPTHTSIPALLHTFQNEWDALVLAMFTLKQQYNSCRQELSFSLYAQDAATRVVARLVRERDAAREYEFLSMKIQRF